MPSGYLHDKFAANLGFPLDLVQKVNRDIDQPAAELGPTHRKVRHDFQYAMELGKRFGTWKATQIALLHYQLDNMANSPQSRRYFQLAEVMMRMQDGSLGSMNYGYTPPAPQKKLKHAGENPANRLERIVPTPRKAEPPSTV